MERYTETQKNLWYKKLCLQTFRRTTGRQRPFIVHYCPFSCSFSPPCPAFAFLPLLPDIPILPSFYAALSLLLLVSFCPCQPPDPLPPLPSFSSSSNLAPCLFFSSSTTASRATDSPLCLSVFFHSRRLGRCAFSLAYCERKRQLTVVQVTGRKEGLMIS